jgi:hypothetical protein
MEQNKSGIMSAPPSIIRWNKDIFSTAGAAASVTALIAVSACSNNMFNNIMDENWI